MEALIAIGKIAPDFILKDLQGDSHRLSQYRGRVVLVNFWSAECPWVERVDRDLLPRLSAWGERVTLMPVASNANEPPELLLRVATERGMPPVLYDPRQQVADLYQAVTTPHFFLVDETGVLRYRGAYDDVTFRRRTPRRAYLVEAVEHLLEGEAPGLAETSPYGCTVVR